MASTLSHMRCLLIWIALDCRGEPRIYRYTRMYIMRARDILL